MTPTEKLLQVYKKVDLTERERGILDMRFGFEDGITHTLEEVGKQFNVTRERIRQIEAKALEKIRMYENERDELWLIKWISSEKMLRIERWRDEYKHWRAGIEWYSEDRYEFIVEKPTLLECLQAIRDYMLNRK